MSRPYDAGPHISGREKTRAGAARGGLEKKMKIRDMQRKAAEEDPENGLQEQQESFGSRIALVHWEISETLRFHRMGMRPEPEIIRATDGRPIGIPVRLAGALLRTAGICQAYGMDLQTGMEDALGRDAETDPEYPAERGSVAALGRMAHRRLRILGDPRGFEDMMAECHGAASRAFATSKLPGALEEHRWLANPDVYRPGALTDLGTTALWVVGTAHRYGIRVDDAVQALTEDSSDRAQGQGAGTRPGHPPG